ncbi:helix-turn-helix transcriptional regulator [Parafrigoribacterium soli]|uniref:helix-turn-helix transcriptional regulator n=1 Tax=Parafrigoribacterium soli TaxID=3144663 RepID=UPI0032EDD2E8
MVEDRGVEQRHAALASQSRRAVLDLLSAAQEPMDAAAISAGISLHITTVRFHLEQLERAELIHREPSRGGQRGRPRVLFSLTPVARSDEGHRQLAEVLADALSSDPDGGRARAVAAGERWADANTADLEAGPDGDVVAPLVTVLERLGFDPALRGAGDDRMIDLLACPFRDTAAAHPEVVCSVHRGLIQRTISTFGREGDQAGLLPFVEPELCLVPLHLGHATNDA